jgi:hypothetical protein
MQRLLSLAELEWCGCERQLAEYFCLSNVEVTGAVRLFGQRPWERRYYCCYAVLPAPSFLPYWQQ